ncbi:MAG: site-specific DNA-methyltransferase [Proteobacteria bacterium]|nr:site-specific DNA-methyltransferase [Pseudomonadota bacterium]
MKTLRLNNGKEIELNQAFNMDCLEFMKELPDKCIDLVLTDPPYGIKRFQKGFGASRFKSDSRANKDGLKWDIKPEKELFNEIFRVSKYQIIWGSNNFSLPESEYFIVWDKKQTVKNFASAELAYTNIKQPAQIYTYGIHKHNTTNKIHPTQKPKDLFVWCLKNYLKDGNIIFDPFLGSFTTSIACNEMGLNWLGCEKDPDYFKSGYERYNQETKQILMEF